jgi:guanylate kinase
MEPTTGTLFVICGPSGVGKSTILKRVMPKFGDRMTFSVSATTREPREGEVHGVDYEFRTRGQFEEMIRAGLLLEHAEFAGNLYGTPLPYVYTKLKSGVSVVLDVEIQGVQQVKAIVDRHMRFTAPVVCVFLAPPSRRSLVERLEARGEGDSARRLEEALPCVQGARIFDYYVVNDDLEAACDALEAIFRASQHVLALGEAHLTDLQRQFDRIPVEDLVHGQFSEHTFVSIGSGMTGPSLEIEYDHDEHDLVGTVTPFEDLGPVPSEVLGDQDWLLGWLVETDLALDGLGDGPADAEIAPLGVIEGGRVD